MPRLVHLTDEVNESRIHPCAMPDATAKLNCLVMIKISKQTLEKITSHALYFTTVLNTDIMTLNKFHLLALQGGRTFSNLSFSGPQGGINSSYQLTGNLFIIGDGFQTTQLCTMCTNKNQICSYLFIKYAGGQATLGAGFLNKKFQHLVYFSDIIKFSLSLVIVQHNALISSIGPTPSDTIKLLLSGV